MTAATSTLPTEPVAMSTETTALDERLRKHAAAIEDLFKSIPLHLLNSHDDDNEDEMEARKAAKRKAIEPVHKRAKHKQDKQMKHETQADEAEN